MADPAEILEVSLLPADDDSGEGAHNPPPGRRPSLVTVLALVLAAVSAVATQLRCVDAAREAARLTARGEQDRAMQLARRIAPRGATVAVTVHGDEVLAQVSANPVAGLLPGIHVGAEAAAVMESVDGPQP